MSANVAFPWRQNIVRRPLTKGFGDLPLLPLLDAGRSVAPSSSSGLPKPDSYYLSSVTGLGELTSEMIAAQVTARTGLRTTAENIVARTIAAGIQDTSSIGDQLSKSLSALANGFADWDLGATTALAALRRIQPMLPRGLNDVINLSVVIGEMGLVRERPRSADVVVAENAEYLVLDRRFLQRLRHRYPRIAATVFLNLTRVLSDRLESTTDALAVASQEARAPAKP